MNPLRIALCVALLLLTRTPAARAAAPTDALWRLDPACLDWVHDATAVRALGVNEPPAATVRVCAGDLYAVIPRRNGSTTVVKGEALFAQNPATGAVEKTGTTRWTVAALTPARAARDNLDPRTCHPSRLVGPAFAQLVVDIAQEARDRFSCRFMRPHEGQNIPAPIENEAGAQLLAATIAHGYVPSGRDGLRQARFQELTDRESR